ncbi:UNVERIFIED_ORG: cell division protease FtsH [Methylobacterium sp. SuP10 SLI 274]|uniref:AAA family ATPase n=1 Tax=Methylorubrum extorquens TaxID=408 RepID=UPI00209D3355|nr:AAA family ATPase [Methylorubrum extorquens]MDF9864161.1 cell division protease FtsH [Methylorubrum pseudosasae]MDH6637754.1 cell division protease FtsH [Methylobacterium sp. SuP10 SLI 274]MDH6666933.1 cell division protease FtsH [Methylorubrum zatmanii]MCP1558839.1 AAA+ superfamily predicted ATPase [Methylorubrum extorquens]MDF9792473.1 cell division protease FtsH [Methylorubrum extorquens]
MKNTAKSPKQTLKAQPASPEVREVETTSFDEFLGESPTPADDLAGTPVRMILAMAVIQDALSVRARERIERPTATAVVVGVPGPDWVEPVAQAFSRIGRWGVTYRRSGANKASDRPSSGSDEAAQVLSAGQNVLGVSQAPERLLPASLITAADIRINLQPPVRRALRTTIFLVTGKRPGRIPDDAVRGLGFDEIVACVRRGSRPAECVRRLVAASRSKLRGDTLLADVPLLKDTWGYSDAAAWGATLIEAVAEWRRGERNWASIPEKSAVVAGPAGTGKSTFARSLAKSLGMPLVATSVPAWFTSGGYLDQVIKSVDAVIAQAVAASPSVLLLDEIDAIPNRSTIDSRHAEYWVALVSHILTQLDSAVSGTTSNLIIVGATNFPERLDEALIRPGRLNRILHIPLPDATATAGILRQHLGEDLPGVDLMPLAIVGAGATGADIASWAKQAREAAWVERRPMEWADLVARVAPPDTRSPAEQIAVARHEAAHAVHTERYVGTVESVSIVSRGRYAGRTNARLRSSDSMSAAELDAFVVSVLCGRAADEHWGVATSGAAGGPGSDLAIATGLIAGKHGSFGLGDALTYRAAPADVTALIGRDGSFSAIVERDLRRLYMAAQVFVSENADQIDAVARRLVRSRILSGAEVRSIVGLPLAKAAPEDGQFVDVGGAHG